MQFGYFQKAVDQSQKLLSLSCDKQVEMEIKVTELLVDVIGTSSTASRRKKIYQL